jgi:hypothetical protein
MASQGITMGTVPSQDQEEKRTQLQDRAAQESDNETLLQGVDEKKLVRKLDLYIIPLVMALYLFSFLDR